MAGQILDDIAATRWHNLKVKCTKFDFDWAPPQTPLGSLQLSPDLLPGVKGPTSKGRGGQRREGMGMGKWGKGKGEWVRAWKFFRNISPC